MESVFLGSYYALRQNVLKQAAQQNSLHQEEEDKGFEPLSTVTLHQLVGKRHKSDMYMQSACASIPPNDPVVFFRFKKVSPRGLEEEAARKYGLVIWDFMGCIVCESVALDGFLSWCAQKLWIEVVLPARTGRKGAKFQLLTYDCVRNMFGAEIVDAMTSSACALFCEIYHCYSARVHGWLSSPEGQKCKQAFKPSLIPAPNIVQNQHMKEVMEQLTVEGSFHTSKSGIDAAAPPYWTVINPDQSETHSLWFDLFDSALTIIHSTASKHPFSQRLRASKSLYRSLESPETFKAMVLERMCLAMDNDVRFQTDLGRWILQGRERWDARFSAVIKLVEWNPSDDGEDIACCITIGPVNLLGNTLSISQIAIDCLSSSEEEMSS